MRLWQHQVSCCPLLTRRTSQSQKPALALDTLCGFPDRWLCQHSKTTSSPDEGAERFPHDRRHTRHISCCASPPDVPMTAAFGAYSSITLEERSMSSSALMHVNLLQTRRCSGIQQVLSILGFERALSIPSRPPRGSSPSPPRNLQASVPSTTLSSLLIRFAITMQKVSVVLDDSKQAVVRPMHACRVDMCGHLVRASAGPCFSTSTICLLHIASTWPCSAFRHHQDECIFQR